MPVRPGRNTFAGMIPTLLCPGVITPGQLGPTRVASRRSTCAIASVMSRAGMPSVMQTMRLILASAASMIASGAYGAGTNTTEVSAWVAATASATESKTGTGSDPGHHFRSRRAHPRRMVRAFWAGDALDQDAGPLRDDDAHCKTCLLYTSDA